MSPGEFYHVFNHANGWENIFKEERNYQFFLDKLALHVLPVCRIYAYCLMKNHFHLLVQARNANELKDLWGMDRSGDEPGERKLILKVSKAFGNFFSSYTQSFNKVYNRMGSLFIPSMKSELIVSDDSFRRVVLYIHRNPIHHGFVKSVEDWAYSSYKIMLSDKQTKIEREYVLKIFGGIDQYILIHKRQLDSDNIWAEG